MAKAIGDDNIAKILTTIRQQHERDRAVAAMFRDGQAADAVKALEEDGRFHLVAGGREADRGADRQALAHDDRSQHKPILTIRCW